jgi:hypothetical protein
LQPSDCDFAAERLRFRSRATAILQQIGCDFAAALSQGVSIGTVSRMRGMMGHTNIKTTQIYAKITKEKISQDMEALSLKMESIEKQITKRI